MVESKYLEPMGFDEKPIEVPVTVGEVNYTLREARGDAAEIYKNAMMDGVKFSNGKPTSFKNLAANESLLVSLCLFSEDGKPVAQRTIRSWPHRIQKDLFDRAKQISELDEEEDTEESITKGINDLQEKLEKVRESSAKNEPASITDGTDWPVT